MHIVMKMLYNSYLKTNCCVKEIWKYSLYNCIIGYIFYGDKMEINLSDTSFLLYVDVQGVQIIV